MNRRHTKRLLKTFASGLIGSFFSGQVWAESDANFSVTAAEKGYSVLRFNSIDGIRAQSRIYEKFGMRLADLEVYTSTTGERQFVGVWEPGTGGYFIGDGSEITLLQDRIFQNNFSLVLKDVERVIDNGQINYYYLFREGPGGIAPMSEEFWTEFTSDIDSNFQNSVRLADVDVIYNGTNKYYFGSFEPGDDGQIFYAFDSFDHNDFIAKNNEFRAHGLDLVDVNVMVNASGVSYGYTGVWRSGRNDGEVKFSNSWDDFKQEWASMVENGYQLLDMDVSPGNLPNTFQVFVGSYKKVNAPNLSTLNLDIDSMGDYLENLYPTTAQAEGMSYAFSRHGQIVRAGATGNAFRQNQNNPDTSGVIPFTAAGPVAMTSETRQTIQSITKLFTAPLVHRLLRLRGLDTDAPISDWLPTAWSQGPGFGGGGVNITFRHLLTHTSGLGQAETSSSTSWSQLQALVQDPTTSNPNIGQPITTPSGYNYSNTNYALFRVLIPALRDGLPNHSNFAFRVPLDNSDGPTVPFNSNAAWDGYSSYMLDRVAEAMDIPVTCDSASDFVNEAFGYKVGETAGTGIDWLFAVAGNENCGAHHALRMSVQQAVNYWNRVRYDDDFITAEERNRIRGGQGADIVGTASRVTRLGIDSTTWHGVGHSGGLIWSSSAGRGDVNTCLLELPGEVTAMINVNSDIATGVSAGICRDLRDAFEAGVTSLPSFPAMTLQAENATLNGANVITWASGYNGSGSVDTRNSPGNWIEFDVNNIVEPGVYRIAIRYSNATSSDRPLDIEINGTVEVTDVANRGTGSWSTWRTANVNIPLTKGNNKVKLIGTGSSGAAMIDQIVVSKVLSTAGF